MLHNRKARKSARRLVLLAPEGANLGFFEHVDVLPHRYQDLIAEMQELRGSVYLAEGAIQEWQLTEGRHQMKADARSWHVLLIDEEQRVCGCARYHEYRETVPFRQLGVAQSALARSAQWSAPLRQAVEAEIQFAAQLRFPFVELGGWALSEEVRATSDAVRMALMTYGLSQALGGGVGISTATRRNCSSSILRRMGGQSLESAGAEIPSYYDPHYRCDMELLRFYSWAPNPQYAAWIEDAREDLRYVRVLASPARQPFRVSSAIVAAAGGVR